MKPYATCLLPNHQLTPLKLADNPIQPSIVSSPNNPIVLHQTHLQQTTGSTHLAPTDPSQHPMVTRSRAGIVKPHHLFNVLLITQGGLHLALFAETNPEGFKTTFKHQHWKDTIQ